jgi:hypothetical protein
MNEKYEKTGKTRKVERKVLKGGRQKKFKGIFPKSDILKGVERRMYRKRDWFLGFVLLYCSILLFILSYINFWNWDNVTIIFILIVATMLVVYYFIRNKILFWRL